MRDKMWISVLGALAALNLAFVVSDTDRWFNMVAAMMAAGALGFRFAMRAEY